KDVTHEKDNELIEREWEMRFSNIIEQSPIATCLLRGPNLIIEIINKHMLALVDEDESIIDKPLAEAIPELERQGYIAIIERVFKSGKAEYGNEMPAVLNRNSNPSQIREIYVNYVFSPFKGPDGKIDGVVVTANEVTNQVKARRALESSEARFRSLIEEAPVATCLFVGKEMRIDVANDIMIGYWGKDRSVIGMPLEKAVPELVGQPFLDILDEVFRTGVTYEAKSTLAILKVNGALNDYYFDFTFKPLFNDAGEVYAIMDMAVDVTASVIATKKLEESELFSRNIIYNSPVAKLVLTGENMVITTVNENMLELLGRDASITGKQLMEAIPELNSTPIRERLKNVLATGEIFYQPEEKLELNRFGERYTGYYNYIYKALHDTAGNNYGIIITATEVTDQVMARQKIEEADIALRGAIELANLGTWEIDIATHNIFFSERLREWFGFEADEVITPENSMEVIIEEERPKAQEALLHAINPDTDNIYDVEYTVHSKKTGKKRILHAMGKAFFNEKGEAIKLRGTAQDVTAQRTLQLALEQEVQERTEELQSVNEELMVTNEELEQLNESLIYSNNELQQFAHVASHDLKEPLRKIKTFIDRIEIDQQNLLTEKSKGFMAKVHAATDRMFSMIEGVLNYSTINASEQRLQLIDLNNVIKDILVDLELLIAQKNATINFTELPVIEGAPILIYQLFYNLIANSLKFSHPNRPPVILIESEITRTDHYGVTEIRLSDNGIGFEQMEAEKIFNTFTRLNSKDQFEGTG
ncbi:MAG: PAS domain-containing protein, partial [Chitinophagaceae bacterium]|nr:PAS domain-containing protein [Chitinophagaceae bacterium]